MAVATFEHRVDADIVLRPLRLDDAEVVFALTEANRTYLREWLPWLDGVRSAADTAEFIRTSERRTAEGHGFSFAIWYRRSIAGTIGHHFIDRNSRTTQIGYWVAAALQGRGITTRASAGIIDVSFTALDLNRVELRCATGNVRSCRIAERLGFRHEGVLREAEWLYDHFVDHNVYGLLKREWVSPLATPLA
jgi:ribosomal-protein-serine acetyltransferase